MTKNQIEYNKLLETQRANRELEAQTRARDATTRELGFANLAETSRSHRAQEGIAWATLGETQRSNLARENVQLGTLQESIRHNRAYELELNRHNAKVEQETKRSNVQREQLERSKLSEQHRANVTSEAIRTGQYELDRRERDVKYKYAEASEILDLMKTGSSIVRDLASVTQDAGKVLSLLMTGG